MELSDKYLRIFVHVAPGAEWAAEPFYAYAPGVKPGEYLLVRTLGWLTRRGNRFCVAGLFGSVAYSLPGLKDSGGLLGSPRIIITGDP